MDNNTVNEIPQNAQVVNSEESKASEANDRMWAAVAHASALAGLAIPFGNLLGPLGVWILKKDESERIAFESKAAINFQISASIIEAGLLLLMYTQMSNAIGLGLPLLFQLPAVITYVAVALGAIKAYKVYENKNFSYPKTPRFLR